MTETTEIIGHLREFDQRKSDWSVYKPRLENYFVANNITCSLRKRAILLNALSEEGYKLAYNLSLPITPETKPYGELITLLNNHFKTAISVFGARF